MRDVNHLFGKLQAVSNTTRQKTSHSFQVKILMNLRINLLIDEIKWAIRAPERYAVSQKNLRYEERVQSRINDFIGKAIKADYI